MLMLPAPICDAAKPFSRCPTCLRSDNVNPPKPQRSAAATPPRRGLWQAWQRLWQRWRWRFSGRSDLPAWKGKEAEKEAARNLRKAGWSILERNWRAGKDEIDLIAQEGEVLVFVEVRARSQHAAVGGYASLTARKREALRRVCRAYLKQRRQCTPHYRLDVIEFEIISEGLGEMRHHENVGLFGRRRR